MASYSAAVAIFAILILLGTLQLISPPESLAQDLFNTPAHELIEIAKDPKSDVRITAIRELARRPMSLDSIVPELARLSMDRDQRVLNAAQVTLREIGESGAKMLRPLFDLQTRSASLAACSATGSLGSSCEIYLPEIKQILETGDRSQRHAALYALKGIGNSNVELLDEVIGSLSDKDFNVRLMACRVLEKYGPKASKAEPRLLELFERGTPSIRGYSAICLASMGDKLQVKGFAGKVAKRIEGKGARLEAPTVHGRYLLALTMLGEESSKKHLAVVRKGLGHHSIVVQIDSALAVCRITGQTEESKAVFEKLLEDELKAPEALDHIIKFKDDAAPFVPAILQSLDAASALTREMAIVALTELGINDAETSKKIEQKLEDSEEDVRSAAKEALDFFEWQKRFSEGAQR